MQAWFYFSMGVTQHKSFNCANKSKSLVAWTVFFLFYPFQNIAFVSKSLNLIVSLWKQISDT
jgi:hypothetical protein